MVDAGLGGLYPDSGVMDTHPSAPETLIVDYANPISSKDGSPMRSPKDSQCRKHVMSSWETSSED